MKKIRVTRVNKSKAISQMAIDDIMRKLHDLQMIKPDPRITNTIEKLVEELKSRGVNINITRLKRIRPNL